MVNVRVDDGSFLASVITIIITVVVDFFFVHLRVVFRGVRIHPLDHVLLLQK